jgi:hypothetical protein
MDDNVEISWVAVDVTPGGALRSPTGVLYRRAPERLKRADCRTLLGGGAPLVTIVYPEEYRWYTGGAATHLWNAISPRLLGGPAPGRRDLYWTAHRWVSDEGHALVLFDGTH